MALDEVELVVVSENEKEILANLMQLYRYDSSEYNDDEIDLNGRLAFGRYFDAYWTEPERYPFFVRKSGLLVGFALVREFEPGKYSIPEFFVARKHRRSGVGKSAAFALFDRFQGEWHVAQEEGNAPAQEFWRTIISEYSDGRYEQTTNPSRPKGPKQIFRSVGA